MKKLKAIEIGYSAISATPLKRRNDRIQRIQHQRQRTYEDCG